ncbi:50S ribosomal protein L11 methyltransferase [Pontibacterium sp.]|jgi:ribosomal protein L11 methyltransferase|uniref:50S ribosomal protein L11 methyltransferase n=1 Tax=Pontibacterium sp. TaxID=2036026 RepID=UPI0035674FB6
MPWLQIKLTTTPEHAEQYEDLLLAAGCASVTYQDNKDQPIFEPELGTTPLWDSTIVTGLFSADHDLDATNRFIRQAHEQLFPDTPFPPIKAEILEDKDWEREWMDSYHPMQFGKRLWVCPSWREAPNPDAVNMMLDPGLAFGTGTHPTTALCLEWLDAQDLDDCEVVDYGCGSGILGIATLLLGAKHVTAVDIDLQALQASKDNLARNKLAENRLNVFLPEHTPDVEGDVIVANILAGPLVELAPTIAKHVKSGGRMALSGLLEDQAEAINTAYAQWFDLEPPAEREGWIRICGIKR